MFKRWLIPFISLLTLSGLIAAYALIVSDLPGRVYTSEQQSQVLRYRAMNLVQAAPASNYYVADEADLRLDAGVISTANLTPLAALGAVDCRVRATLNARYEEAEGVTTTAYDLDFEGIYRMRHEGSAPFIVLEFIFPFPQGLDTLNQVYFLVDGEEPRDVQYSLGGITWRTEVERGEEHEIVVRYRARGAGSFRYALDHNRRTENVDVQIAVRGLDGSKVPDDSLPTTSIESDEIGETFNWQYEALIADRDVQVTLPEQMGFAQRVERLQQPLRTLAFASPLLVVLFVACLAGMHALSGMRLPFLHYLLAGCGFFLFYPALTFLSGVLDLTPAAVVALVAVTALLVVFLGRAAGWRRSWQTLLLAAVFLGLFSLGLVSRWRGLSLTAGGLVLVGAFMMQMAHHQTAKAPSQISNLMAPGDKPEVAEPAPIEKPTPSRYCPHCGTPLDEAFAFCPACGHDACGFRRCAACGAIHYTPPEANMTHCPSCGSQLTN